MSALIVHFPQGGFLPSPEVVSAADKRSVCGTLRGFNNFHDLFDALVVQDRLSEIAAKKFLATGAPFPECKSWKRLHGPGSVEGWILVEADSADSCYEHAAEWAECLDWEVTPVLTDEQAGPLIAKAYS